MFRHTTFQKKVGREKRSMDDQKSRKKKMGKEVILKKRERFSVKRQR